MGWFSKLFSKKNEEEYNIEEHKLESWFRVRTSDRFKGNEERQDSLIRQFEDSVKELGTLAGNLESAELQNKNVPLRVLTFMEGNRENFVKQLRILIENIPPFGEDFHKNYNAQLDIFAQKTKRNYSILLEFFKNEIKEISNKIKEIAEITKKISAGDPNFIKVENALQKIAELGYMRNEIESINDAIIDKKDEIKELNKEREELKRKVNGKKASVEFEQVLNLKELIRKQSLSLTEIENRIVNIFSPFSKILKKYEHSTGKNVSLIESYDKDMISAFINDARFTIADIIKESVDKAKDLGFSKKDQEKLEFKAKKLRKDEMQEVYEIYSRLIETIKRAENDVSKISIIDEIAQLNRDSDNTRDQIESINSSIKILEDKLVKLKEGADLMRVKVKEKVEDIIGARVNIV